MAELSPPTPGAGRANLKLSLGMASIFEGLLLMILLSFGG